MKGESRGGGGQREMKGDRDRKREKMLGMIRTERGNEKRGKKTIG